MTAESTATGNVPEAPPHGRVRQLRRSRTNRVLAGVCGGIAEYYGSDPTAVRLAALIIGLFTGIVPMVVAYIIAAIVVPDGDGAPTTPGRAEVGPGQTAIVLGALLVLVGIAGLANVWLDVAWDRLWPFALIGLGAVIVAATVRPRP
jgi:phage shock protein C